MNFGNFGFMEIMLVLVVVLLLFGAKRIPEIAGSFGKGIKEFKKNMGDVQRDIISDDRIAPPASRDQLPPAADRVSSTEEARPEPKRLLN